MNIKTFEFTNGFSGLLGTLIPETDPQIIEIQFILPIESSIQIKTQTVNGFAQGEGTVIIIENKSTANETKIFILKSYFAEFNKFVDLRNSINIINVVTSGTVGLIVYYN